MKWGVRKKRDNSYNKNYTEKQRKRDRAFYGDRAEKRINRRLNEGHSLQGARHYEVERKETMQRRQRKLKRGARKATNALITIGGIYVYDQVYLNGMVTKAVTKATKTALSSISDIKIKDLNIKPNKPDVSKISDAIGDIKELNSAPPAPIDDIIRKKWR